ncbi:MAG: helix-turn-helix domain-containing protein [Chloroflexota bacterium]|nr:helix-turn-helix domain-containing protein [Chloroflexota bacterium]MDE2941667.1 helix-turn-helix domain-containing protein [Chloroflexota bacterium]MDE3267310.1 helix-turn-helix domain-containing protein [Chloroflexota bacterium]
MRPVALPPTGLLLGGTFLPKDFAERLEHFKEASGLTWDAMAACMGVDPRQLRRWRHGTRPSGDGLFALLTLASQFPGGVHILLGVSVLPPEPHLLEALADGAGIGVAFLSNSASPQELGEEE